MCHHIYVMTHLIMCMMYVYVCVCTTDPDTGEVQVGLVEMVIDHLADPDSVEPNTLEEMDVWGHADPVPYEYGYTAAGLNDGVSVKKHGPGFYETAKNIDNISESELEKWFGASRNHIRDRAIMLVENGHVNVSTLRVMQVEKKIKRHDDTDTLYLLEAKVVTSMKTCFVCAAFQL